MMMHLGTPHSACGETLSTFHESGSVWPPPESPDAAGRTGADLIADLGSVYCEPSMIILGPF